MLEYHSLVIIRMTIYIYVAVCDYVTEFTENRHSEHTHANCSSGAKVIVTM